MLNLKFGVTKNPRFEPLIDGSVKSDKANLNIHVTTPPELFFKNLKNDEFDVFEMSLSEFLITREQAKGDRWQWASLADLSRQSVCLDDTVRQHRRRHRSALRSQRQTSRHP